MVRHAKRRVRQWVDGPELLHGDDLRRRVDVLGPAFADVRILESRRGEGAPVRVGPYSGLHYTVVIVNGGQHHTDWVGVLNAHQEDGRWVTPPNHVYDRGPVEIGSDVWVGYEALIMSGVTVGHGAVVGARAVVTKDVAPYSVVVGNPARHVRFRFDEATCEALLRIKWWDWEAPKVAAHQASIHSPDVLDFVAAHDPQLGEVACRECAGAHGLGKDEARPSANGT